MNADSENVIRHPSSLLARLPAGGDLPHSFEAERAVLAAMMMKNEQIPAVLHLLGADDFFGLEHREIFACIKGMAAAGIPADGATLVSYIGSREIGGEPVARYLAGLVTGASGWNGPAYAQVVRDLATKRRLVEAGERLAAAARAPSTTMDADRLIDTVDAELHDIRIDLTRATATQTSMRALTSGLMASISAARDGSGPRVPSSGFADLDRQLGGGLRAGRLVVFAGRPGMGKTILGLGVARRAAEGGTGAVFFSLEIDGDELVARCVADMLGRSEHAVPYRDILAGTDLRDGDVDRVARGGAYLETIPLTLDPAFGLTIAQIEARSRIMAQRLAKAGTPLGVVVIDYLGLVRPSERYRGQKVDEVGEIALAAKEMAKRMGVCVVLLAQLNRGVESREDKRPLMSDLRDSGNIEEHADAVGLLYRPHYYTVTSKAFLDGHAPTIDRAAMEECRLFVGLGKNRLGPTGSVELWCSVGHSAVRDAARY